MKSKTSFPTPGIENQSQEDEYDQTGQFER